MTATLLQTSSPFHEFYEDGSRPRPHYSLLWDNIQRSGLENLTAKAQEAHLALHAKGVTFTVYSEKDQGLERVWPFDIIPRIIPAAEWDLLATGLKQRVRALNLFLKDLYHEQRILKDGVVPAVLIHEGKDFRREIIGVDPPGDIYTHISGVDLIRDETGKYMVLEDNLRTPSGVSYMIENRMIERRILPEFFSRYRVRRMEHYPALLLQALRRLSPRGPGQAVVVMLTPGIYNSAYFEHTFLAKEMGIELAEGRDLVVQNDHVFLKTTLGLQQVDVIYRRVDDDFLDPLCFRSDSLVGVAGLINAWRAGHVALVNAPGGGIADDKAVYSYVPDIIRYYLAEEPIIANVPTYLMSRPKEREKVLDELEKMVVKVVNESGGYGMLMGPSSTAEERSQFKKKILEKPRDFIAQPVVPLSQHLCYLDNELQSRHLDLRPFIIYGEEIQVVPGGLTRVAFRKGSLVVNSSQGGGSKDTWVVEAIDGKILPMMLSRMADALYWMARYLERADNTARLIEINLLHLIELEEGSFGSAQWRPLLRIMGSEGLFSQLGPDREIDKHSVVHFLTQERAHSGSILQCVQSARENARVVRDRISKEMWECINQMWLAIEKSLKKPISCAQAPAFYYEVRNRVARFHGLTQDTMMRGEAYGFYRLGTHLERADMTARTLDVKYHILLPSVEMVGSALDYYQWAALLKSLSGFEAYRRAYPGGLRPVDVSEFILFSTTYPRSLRFSVERLAQALKHIGFHAPETRTCRALRILRESLEKNTAQSVFKQGLHEYLQDTIAQIADVHAALQTDCFEAHLGEKIAVPD